MTIKKGVYSLEFLYIYYYLLFIVIVTYFLDYSIKRNKGCTMETQGGK